MAALGMHQMKLCQLMCMSGTAESGSEPLGTQGADSALGIVTYSPERLCCLQIEQGLAAQHSRLSHSSAQVTGRYLKVLFEQAPDQAVHDSLGLREDGLHDGSFPIYISQRPPAHH